MDRNAIRNVSRRPRTAEDVAVIKSLQKAIDDCQNAINQSLAMIEFTRAAIEFLDELQRGRKPEASDESQRSAPSSSTTRKITSK